MLLNGSLFLAALVLMWLIVFLLQYGKLCKLWGHRISSRYVLLMMSEKSGLREIGVNRIIPGLPMGFIIRIGALILVALFVRLSIVPDYVSLSALTIFLLLGGCLFFISRSNQTVKSSNWYNLYALSGIHGVLLGTLVSGGVGEEWIGKTLAELNLRKKELLILAIIRGEEIIMFPKGPEILRNGDQVLVFGKYVPVLFPNLEKEEVP